MLFRVFRDRGLLRAGLGAASGTWGLALSYRSFDKLAAGPEGWPSLRDVFSATLDDWAGVTGLVAAALAAGLLDDTITSW